MKPIQYFNKASTAEGAHIFIEQASCSPFLALVYIVGPNKTFEIHARITFEVKLKMTLNSAETINNSTYTIKFADKQKITYNYPVMYLNKKSL